MLAAKDNLREPLGSVEKTKKFNEGLIVSVVAHLVLIAAFAIQVTFFNPPILDLSQSVRVNMVALPDKVVSAELPQKIQDILKEKHVE